MKGVGQGEILLLLKNRINLWLEGELKSHNLLQNEQHQIRRRKTRGCEISISKQSRDGPNL